MNGIGQTLQFAVFLTFSCTAALVAAGCSTPQAGAPAASARKAPVATVVRDGAALERESGPRKSGTYPRFSEPLTAANSQMSDEDAAKMQKQLQSLAAARQSGAVTEAEYRARVEEMRKLAARHGAETQAEIAK